jgi:hypothetical protein
MICVIVVLVMILLGTRAHASPPTCFTREDSQAHRITTTCYEHGKTVFKSEYRYDAQAKRWEMRETTPGHWGPWRWVPGLPAQGR